MYENGAFYCGTLISRFDISGRDEKIWADLPGGETIAYLDRLVPFEDKKLLLRYDGELETFMFNKVQIHEDWLDDIERLYVFSGEDIDE